MRVVSVSGGSRYHISIPNVRLGSWITTIMREIVMLEGGNKNGTLTNCQTMEGKGIHQL